VYESDCQAGEEPFETIDVCTRRVVEEGMGGARNMAGLDVALAAWEGAAGYALGGGYAPPPNYVEDADYAFKGPSWW